MTTLPSLTSYNLMGHHYTLPLHLEGDLNLLLIVNPQIRPYIVESWTAALQKLGREHTHLHYHELLFNADHDTLQEWALHGVRRAGLFNARAAHTTITLGLANQTILPSHFHPDNNQNLTLLLVGDNGRVLWQGAGLFTAKQSTALQEAINQANRSHEKNHDFIYTPAPSALSQRIGI